MTKRKEEYWFDQDKVDHVIEWIETFCTHPVGDLAGERLVLPNWIKKDVIAPMFGWKRKNGTRRYTRIYVEVPRGNAKSTFGTAIALYCLLADGQGTPRVYCAAGSKDQASLVFDPAKMMVQNNPELNKHVKIYQHSITDPVTYGTLKVVSADGNLQQGLNATAVIFDELHVQPNSGLYDALNKGLVKRKEPLLIMFTTAGVKFSFAEEIHDKAVKVRDGLIKDDRFLPVIYAADIEGDDFDEDQWRKANPGWSYLNQDEFRSNAEEAKRGGTDLAAFRRFNLNKWTGASVTWIHDDAWMNGTAANGADDDGLRAFRSEYLSLEALRGRECYVGLDLSASRDTSSAVFIFPPKTVGERAKVFVRVYIPIESLAERVDSETGHYLYWQEHKEIIVTPKKKQDQDAIYEDIAYLAKIFKIKAVAYDSWNADYIVNKLESVGVETKAYKQDYSNMNAPMKWLDSMISEGTIEHGGNPVLRWQCGNLEAKTRTIGGSEYIMPTKSSDKARIDAMVALIIATGIWLWKTKEEEKIEKSIVKLQGMVSIPLR